MTATDIGPINSRRLESPGRAEWAKSVQPGAPDRYGVITIDSHASEPANVYELGGIEPRYIDRVPHLVIDDEGRHLMHLEGWARPQLVKGRPKATEFEALWERDGLSSTGQMWSERMEPDDIARMQASSTQRADEPGLARMHADMTSDGVDAAVVFANRGLLGYATYDDDFAAAMCHAYNVWAHDVYGPHRDRFIAVANLPAASIDLALNELSWIVDHGFKALNIPCKPQHGNRESDELTYNHPAFDTVWRALEECGIPVCMHVATGRDPRAATGSGGAIINKATGFLNGVMTPLAELLASGVFERFPGLRFVTVEADIGWIPWMLDALDHAYYKHHMWVRPWLSEPPSHYYRTNCASSFIEDRAGLLLARDYDLVDNILWSNDYPHHEGTWPHSAQAIERELGVLDESERERVLSGNAGRIFGFDPARIEAATP